MREQKNYLDLAKVMGITLVIMGHSLFPLHIAIDIFHMPLFFFWAGITFKKNSAAGPFLTKKVERIFIPFCFFSILSGILELVVPKVGEGPFNGPLWFLQVILVALILFFAINHSLKKEWCKSIFVFCISVLAFILAVFEIKLWYNLDLALVALSFLYLGFLLKEKYYSLKNKEVIILVLLSIVVYILGLIYSIKLGANGIFLNRIYRYSYVLFYITSLSGIFIVLGFSKIIDHMFIFNYLGKHSMIIMCVHFPLIERLNVLVSKTELYAQGLLIGKIILGLGVYVTTILFSILCIKFFSKYIPKLTGYQPFFNRDS